MAGDGRAGGIWREVSQLLLTMKIPRNKYQKNSPARKTILGKYSNFFGLLPFEMTVIFRYFVL
jgi:hypothetical protein